MNIWKPLAFAAAVALAAPAAQATTVTFTEVGLANGTVVTNQYSAFGITGQNLYQYSDSRDTFDTMGVSPTEVPANIIFTSLASNISFDYVLLAGGSLNVGLYDDANMLLEMVFLTAPGANLNASYSFMAGGARSFRMSDAAGNFGLSTLRFDGGAVPEPGAWALLILGFGAVGGVMRRSASRRVTARFRIA